MPKRKSFLTRVLEQLAPPENRVVAAVFFVRTFGQAVRGSTVVGTIIGAGVTVTDLTRINIVTLALAIAAVLLTASIVALDSYFNVLANGVPDGYVEGAVRKLTKTRATEMDSGLQAAVMGAAAAVTSAADAATGKDVTADPPSQ